MARLSAGVLDGMLALQLVVAWAGEGACEPPRLGWWRTDLVDPAGGGDLLRRLLPRTHRWAALRAVRVAARRADAAARNGLPSPDAARTVFHLGFEVDEQLEERLALHTASAIDPADALALPVDLTAPFDREALATALAHPEGRGHSVEPAGRRVTGPVPDAPEEALRRLVAELPPFPATYPMPYFVVA